tara:strand:+ start:83 stop:328 length:246 start_codon:yes stop_codon:yes gene_type:complete
MHKSISRSYYIFLSTIYFWGFFPLKIENIKKCFSFIFFYYLFKLYFYKYYCLRPITEALTVFIILYFYVYISITYLIDKNF